MYDNYYQDKPEQVMHSAESIATAMRQNETHLFQRCGTGYARMHLRLHRSAISSAITA
jgi:hypothetical protein